MGSAGVLGLGQQDPGAGPERNRVREVGPARVALSLSAIASGGALISAPMDRFTCARSSSRSFAARYAADLRLTA